MLGVVYYGTNPYTQERLKFISGQFIRITSTYKDAASACVSGFNGKHKHLIVLFEKGLLSSLSDINRIFLFISVTVASLPIVSLMPHFMYWQRSSSDSFSVNNTI